MNMDSRGGLSASLMFFTNVTTSFKMKIDGHFLIMRNPADGTVIEVIDTKKI